MKLPKFALTVRVDTGSQVDPAFRVKVQCLTLTSPTKNWSNQLVYNLYANAAGPCYTPASMGLAVRIGIRGMAGALKAENLPPIVHTYPGGHTGIILSCMLGAGWNTDELIRRMFSVLENHINTFEINTMSDPVDECA